MKDNPQLSTTALESELKRLSEKPLAQFLDGLVGGVEERIKNISIDEFSRRYPCRLCHGAGFLVLSGDLFALKAGKLEPVKRKSGGNIRVPDPIPCPRCMGQQCDVEAWAEDMGAEARRGVAA